MKTMLLSLCLALAIPGAAASQVELGVDGGAQVNMPSEGDTWTTFSAPMGTLRVGFPREGPMFETLVGVWLSHYRDTDAVVGLTPGVNLPLGDAGAYLRGEVLLTLVTSGEDDFGVGAAVGLKQGIGSGPVSVRLEAGFARLFQADVSRVRLLMGFSTRIGG